MSEIKFRIDTQTLENYGAHCESGKFLDGKAYWKFKGGSTYIVSGVDRVQDAVAFIASIITTNNIHYKEYVSSFDEATTEPEFDYIKLNVNSYMKADEEERAKMMSNFVPGDKHADWFGVKEIHG